MYSTSGSTTVYLGGRNKEWGSPEALRANLVRAMDFLYNHRQVSLSCFPSLHRGDTSISSQGNYGCKLMFMTQGTGRKE